MTGPGTLPTTSNDQPAERSVLVQTLRIGLSCISLIGVLLLIKLLLSAVNGELVRQLPSDLQQAWWSTPAALGLGLPVPLHIIAIGLVLQKWWLSPRLARIAWFGIITSGCWLGLALAGKLLINMSS